MGFVNLPLVYKILFEKPTTLPFFYGKHRIQKFCFTSKLSLDCTPILPYYCPCFNMSEQVKRNVLRAASMFFVVSATRIFCKFHNCIDFDRALSLCCKYLFMTRRGLMKMSSRGLMYYSGTFRTFGFYLINNLKNLVTFYDK